MKFIMLYGPPATGKLTIAKELQKLSSYKLFHNHLLVDLLESIDAERTEAFQSTHDKIFEETIKFAIKRNVDLINTFVYAKNIDDHFMDFVKTQVENNGGKALFIQVVADKEVLMKRVVEDSRKEFGKISQPERLTKLMGEYDLLTPYEHTDLVIDNTNKSANEVAQHIMIYLLHERTFSL